MDTDNKLPWADPVAITDFKNRQKVSMKKGISKLSLKMKDEQQPTVGMSIEDVAERRVRELESQGQANERGA